MLLVFFIEQMNINWYKLTSTIKKTEIEIIQLQTKNKASLPYYVHVMRDKI